MAPLRLLPSNSLPTRLAPRQSGRHFGSVDPHPARARIAAAQHKNLTLVAIRFIIILDLLELFDDSKKPGFSETLGVNTPLSTQIRLGQGIALPKNLVFNHFASPTNALSLFSGESSMDYETNTTCFLGGNGIVSKNIQNVKENQRNIASFFEPPFADRCQLTWRISSLVLKL
jgi:hypothetical protein